MIDNLYKNDNIVILRQDKGRVVVILNKTDYVKKCETFLSGEPFKKLNNDPTKSFQGLVQRTLLKMKNKFDKNTYKKLYPSSSQPGLFFGLAKIHKLEGVSHEVENLPLRPVVSNIGTSTYQISKFLSEMLKPLTKSEYNIESTNDFIKEIRKLKIQTGYKMVSLDVVSLFTSVPLDFTINLILEKVFEEKQINTKLERVQLKTLLELCTKGMHFSFNNNIYKQINGVAMGSPLGPVLANIFMVNLEETLVPTLAEKMNLWYRYVDDTYTFIKEGEVDNIERILNSFHENIKFTHVVEKENQLAFLDVKVLRKLDGSFDTKVYRKETDNSIYINWKSYSPKSWKIGTLKGLFRRAYLICSNENFLEEEVKILKHVFIKKNGYPSKQVHKTLKEIKKKFEDKTLFRENIDLNRPGEQQQINNEESENVTTYYQHMCLPYFGEQGESILNEFKKGIKALLPKEVKPRIIFKGKKLGSFFKTKDKVKKEHLSDMVYGFKSKTDNSVIDYVGETNVRFEQRTIGHAGSDKNSAIYKHSCINDYNVSLDDFKVLEGAYANTTDRKIAEALYITELKPILNEQVKSHKLHLFN